MEKIVERFLKYISFDTQSAKDSDTFPSTLKQLELANYLTEELKAMGLKDVRMTNYGYVFASIPATAENRPVIGFIAHMDTALEISGKNVNPRILRYEGGDIVLNKEKNIVMRADEFESLQDSIGQDLIVTDGTTLLGADDKAGIAEIMEMAQFFIDHPELPHGKIRIAFTPDEEIGGGTDHFDVSAFGADFAYTVDGGALGSYNYETFNACAAVVTINGISIHPGSAKNKMKNACLLAMEFNAMLPPGEIPALTEGYEGFSHLNNLKGNVEHAQLHYILRDHDRNKLEIKKARFEKIASYLNEKYGENTVEVSLKDSYSNMCEIIEQHPQILDLVTRAMTELGLNPVAVPVRGGTDGCRLSFMGLPCPNLCTGGYNAHGRYEYVSVQSLKVCAELLEKIALLA